MLINYFAEKLQTHQKFASFYCLAAIQATFNERKEGHKLKLIVTSF